MAASIPNATINVKAGTYSTLANVANGVSIVCENGTVFDGKSSVAGENVTIKGAKFTNSNGTVGLTGSLKGTVFEDCVFDDAEAIRYAYAYGEVKFKNCTLGSETCTRGVHFDAGTGSVVFEGCKIYGFTALGSSLTKVTYTNCEFLYNKNYNVINMYNVYEFNNCKFNPEMHADCTSNSSVTADFNGCSYTDNSNIKNLVRFYSDSAKANATIRFDGVKETYPAEEADPEPVSNN